MNEGLRCFRGMMFATAYCLFWFAWMALIATGGCKTTDSLPDTLPSPLPYTTTTTTIPSGNSEEVLQGFDMFQGIPITDSIELERMETHNVYWRGADRNWKPKAGLAQDLRGEVHMYVLRDGKWLGGIFDHIRNGTRSRDFLNIRVKDYKIWARLKPAKGETVAILLISYDKRLRTNAIFTEWR